MAFSLSLSLVVVWGVFNLITNFIVMCYVFWVWTCVNLKFFFPMCHHWRRWFLFAEHELFLHGLQYTVHDLGSVFFSSPIHFFVTFDNEVQFQDSNLLLCTYYFQSFVVILLLLYILFYYRIKQYIRLFDAPWYKLNWWFCQFDCCINI